MDADNEDLYGAVEVFAKFDVEAYKNLKGMKGGGDSQLRSEILNYLRKLSKNHPKKPPKSKPLTPNDQKIKLRGIKSTKKILEKMIANSFVFSLEERLSQFKHYWKLSNILPPPDRDSYTYWFCIWQSKFYGDTASKILALKNIFVFEEEFETILNEIRKRNSLLLELCGNDKSNPLSIKLETFKEQLLGIYSLSMHERKDKLLVGVNDIRKVLRQLAKEAETNVKYNPD